MAEVQIQSSADRSKAHLLVAQVRGHIEIRCNSNAQKNWLVSQAEGVVMLGQQRQCLVGERKLHCVCVAALGIDGQKGGQLEKSSFTAWLSASSSIERRKQF